jgi:superfamily II DNA/RNA helicase
MEPGPPDNPKWTDKDGLHTIQTIVRRCTPWTDGLTTAQLQLVSLILEGNDVLYVNATGSGKSCAFSIPIIVWNEYNTNPELYPRGLKTFAKPVGLVITPTKGLAYNLVRETSSSRYMHKNYSSSLG